MYIIARHHSPVEVDYLAVDIANLDFEWVRNPKHAFPIYLDYIARDCLATCIRKAPSYSYTIVESSEDLL